MAATAHRKRSCSGGRTIAAAGASGADQERPRTKTIGVASAAWPWTSEAAAAISSAKPVSVTSSLRRRQAGGAERDADGAAPPWPAEAVADDHRDAFAGAGGELLLQCECRAVGIERQQQDALGAVLRRDVRMIDAGIGHDKAEAVLDDDQIRPVPHDAPGFGQHDLDKARVLAGLGGERDRAVGGLDGRDVDDAALGFGDDLLRHDQHVAVLRHQRGGGERGHRQRGEIVARLHHRHAGEASDRQLRGHRAANCPSPCPSPRSRGEGTR